ncbi:spore coat protein [Bacillus alkalicellulosilyticus]|uniref:spore coat protein n=1 Tax=Alkalihalobacterium alkalicellulosilyticum TaxID=1912214 RepID=UPI0009986D1C|nr:spore coat protein [Bacillus alkalicellulosilyticus]
MAHILQNIAGMKGMTDQVIATDFLISAKSAVRNLSFALTDAATPEVREALRQQLNDSIEIHENISQYMMKKSYYHPNNISEQLKVDLQASHTALTLS